MPHKLTDRERSAAWFFLVVDVFVMSVVVAMAVAIIDGTTSVHYAAFIDAAGLITLALVYVSLFISAMMNLFDLMETGEGLHANLGR